MSINSTETSTKEYLGHESPDGAVLGKATTSLVAFHGSSPVDQGAALTAQLTAITIADAAGTPDYALQALTTSSPYGLATLAEAVTLLYVIQNLQVRLVEVEARLEEKGLVASN
jgi:hypothetical protein